MRTGYSTRWIFPELIAALAMTLLLYAGLRPEWWGWLIFSPLFLYLCFETIRKLTYSLAVDDAHIRAGSFRSTIYPVSAITAIHVWDAKGGRMAVLDFNDGRRLHFSDRLEYFDEVVQLLQTKANLPETAGQA